MESDLVTVVLVPGLRGRVEEHWQNHLERSLPGTTTVRSFDRSQQDLAGRVADLQAIVAAAPGPVLLAAHSAGCLVTLHWTRRYGAGPVVGALLATPPDLAEELPAAYPSLAELGASGWLPVPTDPLPYPSIVAVSDNDVLGDPVRVRTLAEAWGSEVAAVGAVGHLNPASGYGPWPDAEPLLDRLRTAVASAR